MKRHVFGFAFFALIVGSAVFIDDFIFNEPPLSVVPPLTMTETVEQAPVDVRENSREVSVNVENAVFYVEKNVISATATLRWNGRGEAPRSVIVEPRVFSTARIGSANTLPERVFEGSFSRGDKMRIEFVAPARLGLSKTENYYISFVVKDERTGRLLSDPVAVNANSAPVLVSFGDTSVIRMPE